MRTVRRALRSRALAVVVALAVAAVVADRSTTAARDRAAWGSTITVQVLERDLSAGAVVSSSDLRPEPWPVALVPPGAVDAGVAGRRLRAEVVRGEVLVEHRMAPRGVGSIGAQLDAGDVAVQVPLGDPPVSLEPGDRVDVVAPSDDVDPTGVNPTLKVESVARSARVLLVDDGAVTLAVPRDRATVTAGAALSGMVALVVVG
jgi:Flp pilus assembly protein CpaB